MLLRQVVCLAEGGRAKGTRDRQEREAIATCELAVGPVLHDTGWLACLPYTRTVSRLFCVFLGVFLMISGAWCCLV